ncbi:zinc ribbon domain-containing protein [Gillisia sp. Hel_I_29]|uniref:zinc ribbon domain-containing protein n=1 Tax=Gillisia sp. Hel_I_29 TaxID=1249975 RepID=UPI000550307B|nr:zinc ribbon domain-containing protein [Gillisia sp. Hel_I_29]
MEHPLCQSCGFVLLEENKGTNRDQSINGEYCIHCFQNGEITDSSLSIHTMEVRLNDMAKIHNELSMEEAQHIIHLLPSLKRWKMDFI